MGSRPTVRNYARLHVRWYKDAVLEVCADSVPAALWMWPMLVAMGKDAMHATDNQTGTFKATSKQLAQNMRISPEQVDDALAILAEGELVETTTGKLGIHAITVLGLQDWQVAAGSGAERTATWRDNASRGFVPLGDGSVTARTKTKQDQTKPDNTSSSSAVVDNPGSTVEHIGAAVDELRFIVNGNEGVRNSLVGQLFQHHRRTGLPGEAYHRAAVALQQRYNEGWHPQTPSGAVGYYLATVGSHAVVVDELADPEIERQRQGQTTSEADMLVAQILDGFGGEE